MPVFKVKALILRSVNFQETSRILTVYTEEFGKITIIAKGVRKQKSQLVGILEPTNIVQAIIYKKPNTDISTLTQAELITALPTLKMDLTKLYLGMAILETILKLSVDEVAIPEVFKLAANELFFLDKATKNYWNQFFHFLIGFLKLSGYELDFRKCYLCSETKIEENYWFFAKGSGGIVCKNHDALYGLPKVSVRAIILMQEIVAEKIQTVAKIRSVEEKNLLLLFELYFDEHFENFKFWNSLRLLREVENPAFEKTDLIKI
ncbi:DNA repair protein RecO [bacterium]|nr:DNA repair protein RecO [bacterium]